MTQPRFRYLLPCACGRRIPIYRSQAGEAVTCACGASVTAPTLLKMDTLEMAMLAEAPDEPAWGAGQRLVLAGVVLAILAILPGLWFVWHRPVSPELTPDQISDQIHGLTLVQSYLYWKSLRTGPDPRQVPAERYYADRMARFWIEMGAVGAVLAVAVCLIVAGVALGGRPPRPAADEDLLTEPPPRAATPGP